MALERIEDVIEPVVGRYYLVPTVHGQWFERWGDWPVIGIKHRDKDCFNFPDLHYHFDPRFMPSPRRVDDTLEGYWKEVLGAPLQEGKWINTGGLPAPIWKKLKCKRLANPFQDGFVQQYVHPRWKRSFACLARQFQGRQALHDGKGWVCPHRQVPLKGQPIVDGVIVCPSHLLRIDAQSGRVLPPVGEVNHG